MWHQPRSSSGHIDEHDLVSDSASIQQSRAKTYLHGVSAPQGDQLWQSASGLSKEPSSPMKGMTDSGLCDCGRTDSGFLSGANLTSECLSSDDITSSPKYSDSSVLDRGDEDREGDSKSPMRLDSGVDVGLNDQFGGLSLKGDASINDLNTCSKSRGQDPTTCNIVISKPSATTTTALNLSTASQVSELPSPQPWELYFQQDGDGDTQLHIAIIRGFIEVVESLVQMVPHPCFLDISNNFWQTPLHLAVLTHQPLVVRRLVVAGAKVDPRDLQGNTPLHLACQSGDLECVKALAVPISATEAAATNLRGVGGWRQQVPQPLGDRNNDGQMCVHLATLGGHVDVLRHLLWFGADINAREGKAGRTPLYLAIEYAIPRVVQFLINECPLNLEATTYSGHTAYQLASCLDSGLARFLATKGAISQSSLSSDDSSESDYSDDEMFGQRSPFQFFASHMVNGGAIDIGA